MARNVTVTVDTRKLEALPDDVRRRAAAILDKAAFDVEAGAKDRAPKDTGALANSINVTKPAELARVIADGVEYGIYQEFGTVRHGAQPFLTPAVEAARGPLERAWQELISE